MGETLLEAPPPDGVIATLAANAYTFSQTFTIGDVHAAITDIQGYRVVAFRGTIPSSWRDWLRDFYEIPSFHDGLGWCHAGFLDGAEDLWPLVQPAMSGRKVILAGHSLGGAMAIITAGLMTLSRMPLVSLVTFGAPRACGKTLVKLLKDVEVRQYRNGNDPVPEVPLLYEHVRLPLIQIGKEEIDGIVCHAISAYSLLLAAVQTLTK
jgi:hypothetical protein